MWLAYRPSRVQTLEYCLYCGSGRVARSNRDRWCRADFLEPDGDHLAVRDRVHRHPIVILIARARQLGSNRGAPVLDQPLRPVDQPTRSIDYRGCSAYPAAPARPQPRPRPATVADRLLSVACTLLEQQTVFDPTYKVHEAAGA